MASLFIVFNLLISLSIRSITSIYLPEVDRKYSAYDVAMAFHKAGILLAESVSIEKTKGKYNRIYIGVAVWHDTEVSYNFIKRLQSPQIETRFIYNNKHELWWLVYINKFPHKLSFSGRQKRMITIFTPDIFNPSDQELFEEDDLFIEKYDWVDKLLEKMESEKRYRYELPSLEDDSRPMFY